MKALVYKAPEDFEIVDVPVPAVGPRQVLVKVRACGICRTDIHIHKGRFIARFPLTPGHEFSGVVERVGKDVFEFRPGDRVTADNAVPCGYCYYCKKNKPLYCENFYSLGCNGPGGFAEYVLVNVEKVFKLPDHLSFEEAAFTEPTACIVHCMDVVEMGPGDNVLLFGSGPAGAILAQMARHCGAARVVIAAPTESKLRVAGELANAHTVRIERSDPASSIREILDHAPRGFDVVIDATGAPEITEECPRFACCGGKVVVFGVPDEDAMITINPYDVYRRELRIIGTFAQTHCFERALSYLSEGIVKVENLITHVFPLERFRDALSLLLTDRSAMKILIGFSE